MPEVSDSPGTALQAGYQAKTRNDSFTMTLMFQPSGVGSAIFVPISSGGWSWGYDVTSSNNGRTWALASSFYGSNSASPTTTFPNWTYNVTTCVYH